MSVAPERARELLSAFADQRILVVGDLMLDRYVYGDVSRISPEAPVPVVHVTRDENVPGGASNVAWNIQTLGGQGALCGVLGEDRAAEELSGLLAGYGVSVDAVLRESDVPTIVKTRVIAERQQVVRVDREDLDAVHPEVLYRLCEAAVTGVASSTGVIIEDYGKGTVQQEVVDVVLKAAKAKGIPTGYDPKENHDLNVAGITLSTPNRREAFLAAGVSDPNRSGDHPLDDKALLSAARILYERWGTDWMLITLGPGGMLLVKDGEPALHVPTRAREVFDVSGAGDTVIATCMLALAANGTPAEAADLANYAAGVVVGKLGTAVCSPDELVAAVEAG